MTGSAPRLPAIVPLFTELSARGLKRAHIAVYGAIVAYEALQYVPTCVEIALAANLSQSCDGRDVRRHLAHLVKLQLLTRVEYTSNVARYVPRGPQLGGWRSMPPANDNGEA